jgi:hypothetical protein
MGEKAIAETHERCGFHDLFLRSIPQKIGEIRTKIVVQRMLTREIM